MTGRVVLLCGSPRLEGNTALVLGECAKVLEREGIETETILLAENRILSCTACGLCTGGECALDDSLNDIIRTSGPHGAMCSRRCSGSVWSRCRLTPSSRGR